MGHVDTQRSLPVLGTCKSGLSALAKKLRLLDHNRVALLNAPVAFVAVDDTWTALRFKRA